VRITLTARMPQRKRQLGNVRGPGLAQATKFTFRFMSLSGFALACVVYYSIRQVFTVFDSYISEGDSDPVAHDGGNQCWAG
jgi:hypothetical protein